MTPRLHRPGLQPLRMQSTGPMNRNDCEIRLGFPGYDPLRPCLSILLFDDSWSLVSPRGNDPVARRYQEARRAVRHVAAWTFASRQHLAVLHFDDPVGATGPQRLNSDQGLKAILGSLRTPADAVGTSTLGPSLDAARHLAEQHEGADLTLTVATDWLLTDLDPGPVFERLAAFPGSVHAVAMNAAPPLDLEAMSNVTVTRVSSEDPEGMLAATIAHSLTASRRGRRHPVRGTRRKGVRR